MTRIFRMVSPRVSGICRLPSDRTLSGQRLGVITAQAGRTHGRAAKGCAIAQLGTTTRTRTPCRKTHDDRIPDRDSGEALCFATRRRYSL